MKKLLILIHILFGTAHAESRGTSSLAALLEVGHRLSSVHSMSLETEDGIVIGPLLNGTQDIYAQPFNPESRHNFIRNFRPLAQLRKTETQSYLQKVKRAFLSEDTLRCEIALQKVQSLREIRLLCKGSTILQKKKVSLHTLAYFHKFEGQRLIFRTSKPYQYIAVDLKQPPPSRHLPDDWTQARASTGQEIQ